MCDGYELYWLTDTYTAAYPNAPEEMTIDEKRASNEFLERQQSHNRYLTSIEITELQASLAEARTRV